MILKNNEKGFSLIEVMVAITVLGIGIIGAVKIQHHTMSVDYKTAKFDEANRVLASFCEDTNLADINSLVIPPQQPDSITTLKTELTNNFEYDRALSFQTDSGIKVFRLITDNDSPDGSLSYKEVKLCATWRTTNTPTPHFMIRTVIKPIESDS